MTVVAEDLNLPDGTDPSGIEVVITLVTGGPAGYTAAPASIVGVARVTPDEDGEWEAELVPNADITPAGTAYRVKIMGPGGAVGRSRYIEVPDVAGPLVLQDLLTEAPASLESAALSLHAARRGLGGHLPDSADDGDTVYWDDETGMWVADAPSGGPGGGATQEDIDEAVAAEALVRGNADTALDGRVDALELAPPVHAASHADGGTDEVTLTQAQVTGLIAALAEKATPGDITSAVVALVNGAGPGGDTLGELHARLAIIEALGSLATDAELAANLAAILGSATSDADTLGELEALNALRMLKSENLADLANVATARTNLDVYSKAAVDALIAALVDGQVFTGEVEAPSVKASGKTGATASPLILGGGTVAGAPISGAHVVGEIIIDDDGRLWRCTVAGTPGTWVDKAGAELASAIADLPVLAPTSTAVLDESVPGQVGIEVVAQEVTQYSSGTNAYTAPAWATEVEIILAACGGPGGSGRCDVTNTIRGGGGGGGAGELVRMVFPAASLNFPISAVVGAQGIVGASVSTTGTDGNPGVVGTETKVTQSGASAPMLRARAGAPGAAGTGAVGGAGGDNTVTTFFVGMDGAKGGGDSPATDLAQVGGIGGGGGGGMGMTASGNTISAGSSGGLYPGSGAPGLAGISNFPGNAGTNGVYWAMGGGGGGRNTNGSAAVDGGAGGSPGGGGGGGGAALFGQANGSGAGGQGGSGQITFIARR